MTDSIACLVIEKGNVGDGVARRHILCLNPVLTAIVRINNVPIFTDRDQPLAYLGHIKDQRLGRHIARLGIFIGLNRLRV